MDKFIGIFQTLLNIRRSYSEKILVRNCAEQDLLDMFVVAYFAFYSYVYVNRYGMIVTLKSSLWKGNH